MTTSAYPTPSVSRSSAPAETSTPPTGARDGMGWGPAVRATAAAALLAADLLAWSIAAGAAHLIRVAVFGDLLVGWVLATATAVWLLLRWDAGLYPPFGIAPAEEVRLSARSTFAAAVTHFALLTAVRDEVSVRQLFMLLAWVAVDPLSWALRSGTKLLLVRWGRYGVPVIVVGAGEKGKRALREMHGNRDFGYVPVGIYGDAADAGERIEGVPVLGAVADAARLGATYPVRHVMIAL